MLHSQEHDNASVQAGRRGKGIAGRVIAVLAGVCLAAAGVALLMFGGELKTLGTIEKVDEYPLYTMDYAAD